MNPTALIGGLVLEDGRLWADVAAPFQVDDVSAIFDPDGPLWHFLTRPRGGSKSTDLGAVLLAWLVLEAKAGERGYIVAADRDQGSFAVLDAIGGLIGRTPELHGRVEVQMNRVVARSGATVEVLAADGASTWGLRPSFVVADEVAQWPSTRNARAVWTALVSALGKVPGCRFVVLTSAGEPSHWSRKVLLQALKSTRWHVNEVPGPLPWSDPATLAEQRALLRDSEYARLVLNTWVEGEDQLVTEEDLAACTRETAEPLEPNADHRYIVTLDLGLKNDRTVAVVAHAEPITGEHWSRRRVVVDRIEKWRGTRRNPVDLTAVETWVHDAATRYRGARVIVDPWQATGLCQRLSRRGLSVEEFVFSATSVGRIANGLYLDLRGHALSLPNDAGLLEELGRVRLKETTPGVVRLDHDAGAHDDQAVAVGLACVSLAEVRPSSGLASIYDDVEIPMRMADGSPAPPLMPGVGFVGDVGTGLAHDDDVDRSEFGQVKVSPFA